MKYQVELSARAIRDLYDAYAYIRTHGPKNAEAWRHELERKLASLETFPEACGFAPEQDVAAVNLRQTFHGPFRVVFTIRERIVYVVAIRHGARKPLSQREVREATRPSRSDSDD